MPVAYVCSKCGHRLAVAEPEEGGGLRLRFPTGRVDWAPSLDVAPKRIREKYLGRCPKCNREIGGRPTGVRVEGPKKWSGPVGAVGW